MAIKYRTRTFPNTSQGINLKNKTSTELSKSGWKVVSEQIDPGHLRGGDACCLAFICLPLGFLAGRTKGVILVTYGRETGEGTQDRKLTTNR